MEVVIDDNAGYCSGVVRAIGTAEKELDLSGRLFCLGDIVHNNAEVERLMRKGLVVIGHDDLPSVAGHKVMIRAHGEPPQTYAEAARLGIPLVDATCPIVLALQEKVRCGYEAMQHVGGQVVIFGKPGHAEVTGLNGQAAGKAIIVSHPDELDAINFDCPIRLYSQTTKSRDDYRRLIDNISRHKPADFVAYDTVCNSVANRARRLEKFARSVDVLLFVADANSSNGRYLFEYCQKVQPNTFLLSDASALQRCWLSDALTVGISGATSTPRWLMEDMARQVKALYHQPIGKEGPVWC